MHERERRVNKMLLNDDTRPSEGQSTAGDKSYAVGGKERNAPGLDHTTPCSKHESTSDARSRADGKCKFTWRAGCDEAILVGRSQDLCVNSVTTQFHLIATVAYCQKLSTSGFYIGLRFQGACANSWRWFLETPGSNTSPTLPSEPDAAI